MVAGKLLRDPRHAPTLLEAYLHLGARSRAAELVPEPHDAGAEHEQRHQDGARTTMVTRRNGRRRRARRLTPLASTSGPPASVIDPSTSPAISVGAPSSHDCSITAAATLSTTSRRRARLRPASPRLRSGADRRQPLVVGDYVDMRPDRGADLFDLDLGGPGRRTRGTRQRERQADDDRRHLLGCDDLRDRAVIGRVATRARQHGVGDATVRVGSESAMPMRTVPRSIPSTRPGVGRPAPAPASLRPRSRLVADDPERVVDGAGVRDRRRPPRRPPCPRRRRAPSRPGGRDRVGRDAPLHEILADGDGDARLDAVGPVPASATTPEPSARAVSCASRRSSSLVRPSRPITAPSLAWAARSAAAESASLALSRCSSSCNVRTCSESRSILSGISLGDDRSSAPPAGAVFFLLDVLERAVARDRLDPAQVRSDRALAHDLDRADETERVHVRAAAQLGRRTASSTRTISPYFSPKNGSHPCARLPPSSSRSGGPARRR